MHVLFGIGGVGWLHYLVSLLIGELLKPMLEHVCAMCGSVQPFPCMDIQNSTHQIQKPSFLASTYEPHRNFRVSLARLARAIYIRCIYGIFGREITKWTVKYGAYIHIYGSSSYKLGFLASTYEPHRNFRVSLARLARAIYIRCIYVGLARVVYIHRIWPYIWWFPCQKYRIHTVYIWSWPTLYIRYFW